MSPPRDPLVGTVLDGRYSILEIIGEGSMGVVYLASQISVDRNVAIKVLRTGGAIDPVAVRRFHLEARTIAQFSNPHTVRLIDSGQTQGGLLYFVMEVLRGRLLKEEVAAQERIPVPRALRILMQICRSLQEAHDHAILHRDIKPENIYLIAQGGQRDFVKVLDFSLAKRVAPGEKLTRDQAVLGTPLYMSPEQATGGRLAPSSDIYSCGVVAYEMLAGRPPFAGRLPMEVIRKHVLETPEPLSNVPDEVARIVMRALAKSPAQRQQSAEELERECQACLDSLEASTAVVTNGPNGADEALRSAASRRGAWPVVTNDPSVADEGRQAGGEADRRADGDPSPPSPAAERPLRISPTSALKGMPFTGTEPPEGFSLRDSLSGAATSWPGPLTGIPSPPAAGPA